MTIPSSFRKDLGLGENDTLNMVKIDEMLILTPRKPFGDAVARKVESVMKRKGITLDDLLGNLKDQRRKHNQEAHYTYSAARAKLSSVLEESKTDEIIIKRRKGELYAVTPKTAVLRSPFDIPSSGLKTNVTADDIVGMVRESRERPYKTRRPSRKAKGAS